ncbi:hypothetical protein [Enterovibrio nigricans]|uniref:Uncharacterized protein n=1 Tax=Enterovibrio nigricans DSM 22720 TaxID=1121868 RepID=A0A1T4VPA2_9GAMM|nr:hypothetical protein [Enterovibrio nigricans]PKF49612.1 hypothetical protein AT251_17615 [Enterovibrio nigricans]SKA66351.1 hypothetical protein SAMN02745132_04100 [Enterovibrio nigricans DSM 22720]
MKALFPILATILLAGCSSPKDPIDERIDTSIKLCHSDSTKAYSFTEDGLRVMCYNGSSYVIRGDISVDNIVEMDRVYCSSMGIRDFQSSEDGEILLSCNDGSNYVL